jgi:cell division protein FtsQ
MKTMDRKIAQRRHGVTEQRARARLKVMIALVILAGIVAAGFWIIRSPILSVDEVKVTGSDHSDARAAIESAGIGPGTPMISVDEASLESILLADPWIAEVNVLVTWPGSVEVEITEHVPIAVVQTTNGFANVTATGAVVRMLDDPTDWPVITTAQAQTPRPGASLGGAALLGALEFLASLPPALADDAVVNIDADHRLTASLAGYQIRLGRAIEMGPKAAALAAVIDHGVEDGSSIDVTAPRRPAVSNPQVEVEG